MSRKRKALASVGGKNLYKRAQKGGHKEQEEKRRKSLFI